MTKEVRAYTYREPNNCFLDRDVLDAVGAKLHARQGTLIVFAESAGDAWRILGHLELAPGAPSMVAGSRKMALFSSAIAKALVDADLSQYGAVYAMPLSSGSTVARVSLRDGERIAERIGAIRFESGDWRFVPNNAPEPVVTDAMIDVARQVFADHFPSTDRSAQIDAGIRAIIEAALQAREG